MGAANYHYLSITPAGGSATLLHTMGAGGASVINKAELTIPLQVAEFVVSSNVVTALPVKIRVQEGQDCSLALTLLRTPAVNALLRTWVGKELAVAYRESVAAISSDNPEVTFTGVSDNGGSLGGQVSGGVTSLDVTISVSNGVAPAFDITP